MTPHPASRRTHAGAARRRIDALLRAGRGVAQAARRSAGGECVVCRSWCGGALCPHCGNRFASARERCGGCAAPLAPPPASLHADAGSVDRGPPERRCARCRLGPPAWSRAVAAVDYGYTWDRLLADLKFHDRLAHLDALTAPLLDRLRDGAADDGLPSALRVVPVPLSRERLRERGYNQAWELARRLARALGLDARADALFRVRDTGRQLGLQRDARRANLRDAFVAAPRHAAWVRGAAVALVDDVLTTGATAQAAARALLAAGARDVQLWVVARTPDE
ncbi:MAG: ComF family protein [Burkholderiaceae bacterium]